MGESIIADKAFAAINSNKIFPTVLFYIKIRNYGVIRYITYLFIQRNTCCQKLQFAVALFFPKKWFMFQQPSR